jgi:hypothetical protein
LLFDILLFLYIELFESLKLGIFKALFDMKSHWNCVKHILAHSFIVKADIKEHGLLVTQMEIVFQFVVEFNAQLLLSV